jgi:hypothetical protein
VRISQNRMILEHLSKGFRLTPMDALRLFRCSRLAARIHDLKQHGANIDSICVIDDDGRHYSEYFMKENADGVSQEPSRVS